MRKVTRSNAASQLRSNQTFKFEQHNPQFFNKNLQPKMNPRYRHMLDMRRSVLCSTTACGQSPTLRSVWGGAGAAPSFVGLNRQQRLQVILFDERCTEKYPISEADARAAFGFVRATTTKIGYEHTKKWLFSELGSMQTLDDCKYMTESNIHNILDSFKPEFRIPELLEQLPYEFHRMHDHEKTYEMCCIGAENGFILLNQIPERFQTLEFFKCFFSRRRDEQYYYTIVPQEFLQDEEFRCLIASSSPLSIRNLPDELLTEKVARAALKSHAKVYHDLPRHLKQKLAEYAAHCAVACDLKSNCGAFGIAHKIIEEGCMTLEIAKIFFKIICRGGNTSFPDFPKDYLTKGLLLRAAGGRYCESIAKANEDLMKQLDDRELTDLISQNGDMFKLVPLERQTEDLYRKACTVDDFDGRHGHEDEDTKEKFQQIYEKSGVLLGMSKRIREEFRTEKSLHEEDVFESVVLRAHTKRTHAGGTLEGIPKELLTYESCFFAVERASINLKYTPKEFQDYEMIKAALAHNCSRDMEFVHDDAKTPKVLNELFSKFPEAMFYIPPEKQTPELCWRFINLHPNSIRFIYDPTDEMCAEAVRRDATNLVFVPQQTKELCKLAIAQNRNAVDWAFEY